MSPPNDPVARRSPRMVPFFERVMRGQVARNFRALRVVKPGLPNLVPDRPVMVFTNHPSWWDPAVFMAVTGLLFPGRAGFGPIEAEMLKRYPFMARIGVFGVRQDGPRGAAHFLRTARHIVSEPDRILWITAQGRFADPRERPLALRPGAAHLLGRCPHVQAVPMAIEYPFWTERRPEALLAFGPPIDVAPSERPAALAGRLETALIDTADALATRAIARDPGVFDTLIDGSRGTGGVYGQWQRLRDRLAGRQHMPDHEPRP
ncbi:lysophospholipid acyltransferase family protein [Palleronia sp.]|uniref:lysophospholipid acyltransferase family protein n=1 Tax=Palleronia sp. TaxID=1940284 RepID=UPI0035C86722